MTKIPSKKVSNLINGFLKQTPKRTNELREVIDIYGDSPWCIVYLTSNFSSCQLSCDTSSSGEFKDEGNKAYVEYIFESLQNILPGQWKTLKRFFSEFCKSCLKGEMEYPLFIGVSILFSKFFVCKMTMEIK